MKITKFLQIAFLILLAAGAQPASSAFYQWSVTAGNNATADPTINFAEGQAPSSLNDSARAMMAALARWRNDTTSSTIFTGGTSTAYTFASSQGFDTISHATNQIFLIYFHANNGANPTMSVDGLGQFPIFLAGNATVPVGSLKGGSGYFVGFYGAQWNVISLVDSTYNLPLGAYLYSSIATAPNANFVAANGGCISRTTYAAYFAAVGVAYGNCDGATTFGVPDMRGRVGAMVDGGAGRLTSSGTGCGSAFNLIGAVCGNGTESKNLSIANINSFTPTVSSATLNITGNINVPVQGNTGSGILNAFRFGSNDTSMSSISVSGATLGGTASVTMNALGSGTAHPTVQPTYAVAVYVRVL